MPANEFETALRDIALGGFRYFATTGSSNDEALAWAADGAPDFSLVVAGEQTHGRGRDGRRWFTPPEASLAFSLVLRPTPQEREHAGRFAGLGALALVAALRSLGLEQTGIKWPNDVLIGRKKVAGILVEAVWTGAEIDSLVLGMGVNVDNESVPPEDQLNYPATCVAAELGRVVQRAGLLRDILAELAGRRASMLSAEFMQAWQEALVFRGEQVRIWQGQGHSFEAVLLGLEGDGSLVVQPEHGEKHSIHFGEVHMRPLE